jgi:hypothetical protein
MFAIFGALALVNASIGLVSHEAALVGVGLGLVGGSGRAWIIAPLLYET